MSTHFNLWEPVTMVPAHPAEARRPNFLACGVQFREGNSAGTLGPTKKGPNIFGSIWNILPKNFCNSKTDFLCQLCSAAVRLYEMTTHFLITKFVIFFLNFMPPEFHKKTSIWDNFPSSLNHHTLPSSQIKIFVFVRPSGDLRL